MNLKCLLLPAILLLAASGAASAVAQPTAQQSHTVAGIEIVDAWVQAPPNGAVVAAGYMRIVNHGAASDRLLAISSPRAGRVEMHDMTMEGAIMRMRALPYGVAVAANHSFEFSPMGPHVMFNNMSGAYEVGQTIPVRLTFQHAGNIDIAIPVRAMGAGMHH
jgi:copper(I)-binding protein